MLDSVANLLTGIMVFVLVVLLLSVFGGYASAGIPTVSDFVGYAAHQLWIALERIVNFQGSGH
jgi:uncharacterized membrane protein YdfJ with MMPL/SSD domain